MKASRGKTNPRVRARKLPIRRKQSGFGDATVEKWQRWIDAIRADVGHVLLRRTLFRGLIDIRAKSSFVLAHGNALFWFLGDLFRDSVLMGIRRQVKSGSESISLVRLLTEIAATPHLLSRKRHVSFYRTTSSLTRIMASREFDGFSRAGGAFVDSDLVRRDIQELRTICRSCEAHADKRVAHYDRKPPKNVLEPSEVYAALDAIERLVKRYYLLPHVVGTDVEPVLQMPIWYVFSAPWIGDPANSRDQAKP